MTEWARITVKQRGDLMAALAAGYRAWIRENYGEEAIGRFDGEWAERHGVSEQVKTSTAFLKPKPKRDVQYIYFVKAIPEGSIKIGMASDVMARLDALQAAAPCTLQLVCAIEGTRGTERRLHTCFAPAELHNEWFEPTKPLTEFLAALTANAKNQR